MTPPTDDLYAFLGIPVDAPAGAIGEAIARTEKRLSGKHGLGLTELSRQRALLLQTKRWLLADDRRAEYDSGRTAKKVPAAPKKTSEPVPSAPKPRPGIASAAPAPSAAPPSAPLIAESLSVTGETEEEDEGASNQGFPLGLLLGGLVGVTLLAFAVSFGIVWVLGGGGEKPVEATTQETETPTTEVAADVPAETETSDAASANVVRASGDEVILTPSTARLIGANVRLDGTSNPPRIENWTSVDSLEWDFESPSAAIYQARLDYGMKPTSEGNRYRIVVGTVSVERIVGGGSYRDGFHRDVFFLKIPNQGLTTLKIEPLDVVGGELMEFRSLTLAPRQKTYGD